MFRTRLCIAVLLLVASCKGPPASNQPEPAPTPTVAGDVSESPDDASTADVLQPCSVTVYEEPSGSRVSLTAYSYDTSHRITSQTTYLRQREPPGPSPPELPGIVPERQTTRFSYPDPNTVIEEFDEGDDGSIERRTVTVRVGQVESVEVDYGADGEPDEVITRLFDESGRTQSEARSIAGRPVSQQSWQWNDDGSVAEHRTISEGVDERTVSTYDAEGRQIRETHYREEPQDRSIRTYEYEGERLARLTTRDASGQVTETVVLHHLDGYSHERVRLDADGEPLDTQLWTANEAGQVVRKETRVGDRVTRVETLEYDEFGDLASVRYEHAGTYTVRHENLREDGRLIETRYVRVSGEVEEEYLFSHLIEYNQVGQRVAKIDSREGQVRRRWEYLYNQDVLTSERCDGCTTTSPLADGVFEQTIHYEYDDDGRPIRERIGGGPSQVVSNIETVYAGGLTTTTIESADSSDSSVSRVERTFDERNNLLHVVRFGRDQAPIQSVDYSYDSESQLIEEVRRDSSGAAEFTSTWLYRGGLLVEQLQDGPGNLPADGQADLRTVHGYDCWNDPSPPE